MTTEERARALQHAVCAAMEAVTPEDFFVREEAARVLAAIVELLGIDAKMVGDAAVFEEVARGTTVIPDTLATLLAASQQEEPQVEGADGGNLYAPRAGVVERGNPVAAEGDET